MLAQPLKKGESASIKITYSGKDVVINEGSDNYYPVARENWYPNAAQGLGNYATYKMTFHVPKGLQLIATGTKVNESTEEKSPQLNGRPTCRSLSWASASATLP